MRQLSNSAKIAFSMYSRIPMPKADWEKDRMKYIMCFFPLVGVVIGILEYIWIWIAVYVIKLPSGITAAIFTMLPVWITGGIHLDGMMDTADALGSCRSMEERRHILKDTHCGAFAVLSCISFFLLYAGFAIALSRSSVLSVGIGFVLSRTLSALSVLTFPKIGSSGLVAMFSEESDKKRNIRIIRCYLAVETILLICIGRLTGIGVLMSAIGVFGYYRIMSKKQFGGINGDLAGYFLQICELVILMATVIISMLPL